MTTRNFNVFLVRFNWIFYVYIIGIWNIYKSRIWHAIAYIVHLYLVVLTPTKIFLPFSTSKFQNQIKMQILEPMRISLQVVGMSTYHSNQKYPINARNLTCLYLQVMNVICNIGFMISGAKDMMEFTDSLFLTITAVLTSAIFINLNWKMQRLFEFFDHLEDTVQRSKWNRYNLWNSKNSWSLIFILRTWKSIIKGNLHGSR